MQNNPCFGVFLLFVTCCLYAPYAVAMAPGDGGIEVWVDGPDEVQPGNDRRFPDAAVDPKGRSLFVWVAFANATRGDIFLRRFDSSGNALEDPIAVNTLVEDDQTNPRLAVSNDGSFLVIWQSDEPDAADEGRIRRWIRAQAFDADAQPDGEERLISAVSTAAVTERYADVAALTGGGYVVVWNQESAIAPDTGRHIQARLVSADGAPNGDAFVANSSIGTSEFYSAVTELDDGGFFAVWRAGSDLWGRQFNSTGAPVSDDFKVDTFSPGSILDPDVVRGADGRVLVVWEDGEEPGDGSEIRGRLYSPTLNPLGDDFRINVLTESTQTEVRAGSYGKYGFMVAWESAVSAGDDTDSTSIQGRMVTGVNAFGGPQFTVNKYTTDGQSHPGVGGMGDAVAIAWRSIGNDFKDNDDVITGQGWSECGIFCDSFEATKTQ
jgi:hypothetical protein